MIKIKLQLINKDIDLNRDAKIQILMNRGFTEEEAIKYCHLDESAICDPETLGKDQLDLGIAALKEVIENNDCCSIIVDSDADGFTSSALLVNYLYKRFPNWVKNNVQIVMHEGKQHGLSDTLNTILDAYHPKLIICPDSSSNDYEYHKQLADLGIKCLVLDHHLAEKKSENAIVINNQLSNYPNKSASGVCVTWQFCRYWDRVDQTSYANQFLDLVALGLCGDMMSLKSFETRFLITQGFKKDHIQNPFIEYMLDKNSYSLTKAEYSSSNPDQACTSIGAAFFIVPFINATTRVGTMEEKTLIFNSMLEHLAYKIVESTKKGHKLGDTESIVEQAVRTVTNIKNRQTKLESAGVELLETMIEDQDLLDNKILLFALSPNEIDSNIRGLCANKMSAKYQRPCCIVTESDDAYLGSMRGYTKTGLTNFKSFLEAMPQINWVEGHPNAAGMSISKQGIDSFISDANEKLKDLNEELVYQIDYSLTDKDEQLNNIVLEIGRMNDFWGQDIDRPLVAVTFTVTDSNVSVYKGNTLSIKLSNGCSLVKFKASDEEILYTFTTIGKKKFLAVCECNINSWGGYDYPQLMIKDYQLIDEIKYVF